MRKLGLAVLMAISLSISVVYGQYLYLIENDVSTAKWVVANPGLELTGEGWALEALGGEPPEYVNFTADFSKYSIPEAILDGYFLYWTDLDRTDDGGVYDQRAEIGSQYEAHFTLAITALDSTGPSRNMAHIFLVTEVPADTNYNDWRDLKYGNKEFYSILIYAPLDQNDVYQLQLTETESGDTYSDGPSVSLDVGQEYYLSLYKNGTALNLEIYGDEQRTNLLDELSLTLHGDWTFKYLWALCGVGAASGNRLTSGYLSYLTFDEVGGGYKKSGTLYTEDLLGNTTMGPAWVFCLNASIPQGTSLSVSFSEDNQTWGSPIGLTDQPTRTAIFLEDYNYTQLYTKFQFSGDGANTPRLNYMSMAYKIDDPGEGANGWIYLLAPIALILGYASKGL